MTSASKRISAPSLAGTVMTLAMIAPFVSHALPVLFVSAAVVGTSFMMQHIALNHVIGSLGDPADRPINFSWFALGYSISGFLGPLLAGFAVDLVGHNAAFLLLAIPPTAGIAVLMWRRGVPESGRSSCRSTTTGT